MNSKYRIWDEESKTYPDWSFMIDRSGRLFIQGTDDILLPASTTRFVREFNTGLKDTNWREIYENDILRLRNPYNGEWTTNGAAVVFSHEYVGGWVLCAGGPNLNIGTRTDHVEIIGNIHENPELLTQDQSWQKNSESHTCC